MITPGSSALKAWLPLKRGRGILLASAAGVSADSVYLWVAGRSRPRHTLWAIIEETTGGAVPVTIWGDPRSYEGTALSRAIRRPGLTAIQRRYAQAYATGTPEEAIQAAGLDPTTPPSRVALWLADTLANPRVQEVIAAAKLPPLIEPKKIGVSQVRAFAMAYHKMKMKDPMLAAKEAGYGWRQGQWDEWRCRTVGVRLLKNIKVQRLLDQFSTNRPTRGYNRGPAKVVRTKIPPR